MILKVFFYIFYSSLFQSLYKKDSSAFLRSLKTGFFPLFLRSYIFSYLIKESLNNNFFMGAWLIIQYKNYIPDEETLTLIAKELSSLDPQEFKLLKDHIPLKDSRFTLPKPFQENDGKEISLVLFNRLKDSLETNESIALVDNGRPWNLPRNKMARCYWDYMSKYSDLGNALSVWRYLVTEDNRLSVPYFQWLALACETYPHSIVFKTLKQKKALVCYSAFTHKEVLCTTIQELFPGISSRVLRNKILGPISPFFKSVLSDGEVSTWQHDQVVWFNHLFLEFPHFKPDWFLEGEFSNVVYGASPGFLNSFTELSRKLKDAPVSIQKSLVLALMDVDHDLIYEVSSLISETSDSVVEGMVKSGEGTISTLLAKLKEYHEIRPDLVFDQHLIDHLHGKTFVFQKKNYEVVVPKISQELIDAGKDLKNCVGDGEYADEIMDNETSVFLLKTNGSFSHCFEVDGFKIVEAKGKNNVEAGERFLARICQELDLENGT